MSFLIMDFHAKCKEEYENENGNGNKNREM